MSFQKNFLLYYARYQYRHFRRRSSVWIYLSACECVWMAIAQARLCCVWNAIVGKAFVCVCECAQNWWLMRFALCMNRQASVSLHYWLTSSHRNDWLTFGWLYVEHLLQSCFEFYTDQKHSAPVLIRVSFHSVNLPPHAKFHHIHSVIHTDNRASLVYHRCLFFPESKTLF